MVHAQRPSAESERARVGESFADRRRELTRNRVGAVAKAFEQDGTESGWRAKGWRRRARVGRIGRRIVIVDGATHRLSALNNAAVRILAVPHELVALARSRREALLERLTGHRERETDR